MPTDDQRDAATSSPVEIGSDGIPRVAGIPASRRSFLKLVGFTFAAGMLTGCGRGEEHDAVPFLEKPEETTAGTTAYMATLCSGCDAGCGLVASVRDGRPIKLEGNTMSVLSAGRTCAAGQASLLSLYDSTRFDAPQRGGKASSWEAADAAVGEALKQAKAAGKGVRVLTGTVNGPTRLFAIERFAQAVGGSHVSYDAVSCAALLDAHAGLYGRRFIPRYQLENALALVSIDADFLSTWISPVEHTRGWTRARELDPGNPAFCHHVQFESRMSLTGTNADRRHTVPPADLAWVAAALAERVAAEQRVKVPWGKAPTPGVDAAALDAAAARLMKVPRGRALVLCGVNDPFAQGATAYLNHLLGADDPVAAERTVDLSTPSRQRTGSDTALTQLIADMNKGTVGVLIVAGCNPAYDLPAAYGFADALAKVDTVISAAERADETTALAGLVCPDTHPLESWDDAEPVAGTITVGQPVVRRLRGARPFIESLAAWGGTPGHAREIMRAAWKARVFPRQRRAASFDYYFAKALHDGQVRVDADTPAPAAMATDFIATAPKRAAPAPDGALHLVLYEKTGIRDGRHAHNPWLHELPDPVSKVSWDNYASVSPATASRLGLEDGDIVRVAAIGEGGAEVSLPVIAQPGQADDTVAVAVGYGRAGTDRFTDVGPEWIEGRRTVEPGGTIGEAAAGFITLDGAYRTYGGQVITLTKAKGTAELARTQIYHSLDVPAHLAPGGRRRRHVAQHTTLDEWRKDPKAGAHSHPHGAELWKDDHAYKGHHWGLAIDLSACTGCGACVMACQAENNVPVVGKDEVYRQREMHWLRIDRYFQGEGDDVHTIHQPMMCQQCDHAPCETVCPVLATVHSSEGLNQQVYNRCVGTRYCSNNCPYKVRRFNWFDYQRDDRLQNMALNPDVTVRSRGVMEKCTFCVQRIQDGKAAAKRQARGLRDNDIQTACMQACPANAVVFGDMNDTKSGVRGHMGSPRAFRVLEEIGVRPSVTYLRQVQDRPASAGEKHHG